MPYKTKDFRGDPVTVVGFTEPHKSASSGRIETSDGGSYFPGVAGLKIVGHQFESTEFSVNEDLQDDVLALIKTDKKLQTAIKKATQSASERDWNQVWKRYDELGPEFKLAKLIQIQKILKVMT